MKLFDFLLRKKAHNPNSLGKTEEIPYLGLLCSTTGCFGYSYQRGNKEVFSVVSPVVPDPDITLMGFGKQLYCKVDSSITQVEGIRRYVMDSNNRCYGFYEFADTGKTYAQIGEKRICIVSDADGWSFSINSENDACIKRIPKDARVKGNQDGFDTESRFIVEISDEIDSDWYPMIFGTPMLSF